MARFLFNCRQTAGFVTDPADATYLRVGGTETPDVYPTTRNGITFGVEDTDVGLWSDLDRNSAYDPSIAGLIFTNTSTPSRLRIDLPASGAWNIYLAVGGGVGTLAHHLELWDTTTVFATYTLTQSTTLRWFNAASTEFDATGSAAIAVPLARTFTSTIFRLVFGDNGSRLGLLAHVGIEQASAPSGAGLIFRSRVIR